METTEHDIRCDCGKLLARWKDIGFEVKCQRCKRHHLLRCGEHSTPSAELPSHQAEPGVS